MPKNDFSFKGNKIHIKEQARRLSLGTALPRSDFSFSMQRRGKKN